VYFYLRLKNVIDESFAQRPIGTAYQTGCGKQKKGKADYAKKAQDQRRAKQKDGN
jgi:hypothetical protein